MNEHSFVKGPSEDESGVLRYCGKVPAPLAPKGVLGEFVFKCTLGMWVDDTFTRVLGGSVFFGLGNLEVGKYQLQEKMSNSEILLTTGPGSIYRGDEGKETLKRIIAASIINQWKGGLGLLLANVQSNLFYFEEINTTYVIKVFHALTVHEWNVNMWRIDHQSNDWWEKGDVVFTPALKALK